jgi:hypothetical protein
LKRTLLIYLILLANSAISQSQRARLSGTVVSESGNPLSGVEVRYDRLKYTTFTDSGGQFTVSVLANEAGVVSFLHAGQLKVVRVEPIPFGGSRSIRVVFDIRDVGQVDIRAKKSREIPDMIEIEPKALERFPVAGGFEQVLKSVAAGISTTGGELTSGYSVRGGNFDENLVYVNGFEVYRPFLARSGQQEGLSFINGDMVKSVRFSAGGFEAQYGDKLSSVLDIQYSEPDSFGANVNVSLLGARLHAEDRIAKGKLTYNIGARVRSNQYLLNSLDVQGAYRPFFADIQSYWSYDINDEWQASWLSAYSRNRFLLEPQSQSTSFGTVQTALNLFVAFGGAELMAYQTWFNGVGIKRSTVLSDFSLQFSAYNTTETEHFTVEGAYRLDELDNNLGSENFGEAKATLGTGYFIDHARNKLTANVYNVALKGERRMKGGWYPGMGRISIMYGGKIQAEEINDVLLEWRFNDSAGYNLNKTGEHGGRIVLDEVLFADLSIGSIRYSAYSQFNIDLAKKYDAVLRAGVRTNYWTYNNQNVISPRVQFSFKPNKEFNKRLRDTLERFEQYDSLKKRDWIITSAFGYYYQPPFYRELRDFNGTLNPELRAQKSIHAVLGAEMDFISWGRPFKLKIEGYYKHLDDLVPYLFDNVRIRYYADNMARGYAYGLDARVNGEFIKGLESWFNFSLLNTREVVTFTNESGEITDSEQLRRPTDQRVNLSILFQDELPMNPSYKMNLNLVYGSGLPYYFDGLRRFRKTPFNIPAYRRVDLGLSKVIWAENDEKPERWKGVRSLWVGIEIFNLLQVNNTISFTWVKDIQNNVYGVPNYLTSRRINARVILKI